MYESTPKWRLLLVPPYWFRLLIALGASEALQIYGNPKHPVHARALIHECMEARARYRSWLKSLTLVQRQRYFWGLPTARWLRSARIIRPLQWHPELARAKREHEEMQEWSRRTGRDPIESPVYQARLARVRERLRDSEGE